MADFKQAARDAAIVDLTIAAMLDPAVAVALNHDVTLDEFVDRAGRAFKNGEAHLKAAIPFHEERLRSEAKADDK